MAAGTYKNGVAIIVTYQAVACGTSKTITMSVYDEAHALDEGQSGSMAEIGATGRYWKTFTPDAEGEWIITITNTTDGGGDVVKAFAVGGHDVDSIGDGVAAIQTDLDNATDGLGALKTLIEANAPASEYDTEMAHLDADISSRAPASEYDTEMARITANVATETKQDIIDGFHDVPGEDGADDAQMRDVIGKKTDTVAGNSLVALAKQLLADTGTTGSIRGADDDTLKTLSDQIDAVAAPAMVG